MKHIVCNVYYKGCDANFLITGIRMILADKSRISTGFDLMYSILFIAVFLPCFS